MNTIRFLKYIWPFFNIIHEMGKGTRRLQERTHPHYIQYNSSEARIQTWTTWINWKKLELTWSSKMFYSCLLGSTLTEFFLKELSRILQLFYRKSDSLIFPGKFTESKQRLSKSPPFCRSIGKIKAPRDMKYWVGVQGGQSYLMGRRCLFSLGWQRF